MLDLPTGNPSEQRESASSRGISSADHRENSGVIVMPRDLSPDMAPGYFPPPDFCNTPKTPRRKRQRTCRPGSFPPDGRKTGSALAPVDPRGGDAPYRGYFPPPNFNPSGSLSLMMSDDEAGTPPVAATSPIDPPHYSNDGPLKEATDSGNESHRPEATEKVEIPIYKGKTVLRGKARRALGVGKKVTDGYRLGEAASRLAQLGSGGAVYSMPFRTTDPPPSPSTLHRFREANDLNAQGQPDRDGNVNGGVIMRESEREKRKQEDGNEVDN